MLLLALSHHFISEKEFLVLFDATFSKNPSFPLRSVWSGCYGRNGLPTRVSCKKNGHSSSRSSPYDSESLCCNQRSKADRIEELCKLLKRFAYPCWLRDIIYRFGRVVPEIRSMITTHFQEVLYNNHHSKITEWNNQLLSRDKLEIYSNAIAGKRAALSHCFGFLDGTMRPINL